MMYVKRMRQYKESKMHPHFIRSDNTDNIIQMLYSTIFCIDFRINLENDLKNFLQFYDTNIGECSFKLRNYKHTLRDETKTLTEWQEKYNIQDVLYNEIQANKEAEEEKRREERILLFMMNRVARIIQRQYRRILAQRKAKKRGKGKKGGKTKK